MKTESKENLQEPLLQKQKPALQAPVKPVSFFRLFKYADSKDRLMLFVGTLASIATGTAFPFFMIYFGDISTVFIDQNRSHAAKDAFEVTLKFFIIGLVTWGVSFIGLYCWNMSGSNQSLRFKKMYYKALLDQQVAWYDSHDVNKLATQVATNISQIQGAIGQKVFVFVATVITSIFGFFYAYFKCWQLSLVLTGVLPFMMIAGAFLMKAFVAVSQKSKISYQQAAGRAQQAFGGIKTIKSLVAQSFQQAFFTKALDKGQQKSMKLTFKVSFSLAIVNIIFLSVYGLGFWYGKHLLLEDNPQYNAGTIIGTFFCFVVGGSSISQISPILKNFAQGKLAVSKLQQLMKRQKTLIEKPDGQIIKTIQNIEFKNVSFVYKKDGQTEKQNENLVLDNVNLTILKNKVNALVGESGSGKSTISQLLMRYYDPTLGEVKVNNIPLQDCNMSKYRRKIGFVGQQPVLFAMSIRDNIKLANPKLKQDEIIQILKKANAWQFISNMQKKIDTYVGTGGTQLSGGQKQRIAIARAISKKPNLLILDQATSALDRKNQKQIQKTLRNLEKENITTIVIAHRLSTIKDAQKITVLSKGKIMEQGTHDELYKKQGLYYELIKSQIAADSKQINELKEQKQSSVTEQGSVSVKQIQNEEEKNKQKQPPKQQQEKVFGKLFKFGSKHNLFLFLGALFALINGSIWPVFNIAFSNILALLAEAKKYNTQINEYCLLFVAIAVFGAAATFAYTFCFGIYGQRLVYDIRISMFKKLLRIPVSFYDKKENTPGAMSTKLATDAYTLNNMISGVLAVVCLNLSTISLSLGIAFYYSWQLTLIVLCISPLIAISGAVNMALLKKLTQKTEQSEKFLGSLISDTVCNIRTVKSFGNDQVFLHKYAQKLDNLANLAAEKACKSSFFQGMGRGMIMVVEGLTFWIAGILFENGTIHEGKAVYIAIFSVIFAAMGVGQNSSFMPDMAKTKIAGAHIFQILQSKTEKQISQQNGGTQQCTLSTLQGNIEFKNVTFKYPQRDQIILQNFSLKLQAKKKYAFVGPSGSGKSTIVQLIERFYPLQQGTISINGIDINNFDLYSYREKIGYVSQQPTLFQGTVKQNIAYNHQTNDAIIDKYAEVSHSKKFIDQFQQKYEKQVGSKGSQVSGGQKQRIALTRCLIREPSLFLFDQSTSALDMDTQKIVFSNLKQILKNKTSISIAHRLATIEDADKIIVMREGKIIQQGQYNELMEKKEHFYRLAQGN